MHFICFNGKFLPSSEPVIMVQSNSYKWGDGIFETMKLVNGSVLLASLHFQRLFSGMGILQMNYEDSFSEKLLTSKILELCKKNHCTLLARIRLSVYRSGDETGFVIEASSLSSEVNQWNEKGWTIEIYPCARKSIDAFSNLKTANFLPYVMAGLYAKEHALDDAIVLNAAGNICDSSMANIFLVKNKEFFTPALHQGCIDGVIRRQLIEHLKKTGLAIHQTEIGEEDLLNADEIFLTNSVRGMRWVKSFKHKEYGQEITRKLYNSLFNQ